MATAFAIEGFSATHKTLVTISRGMVLRVLVSFHGTEEAGLLLSLGLVYARILRSNGVGVEDLESKVLKAVACQHRPHQRSPSPSDFTLSRATTLHQASITPTRISVFFCKQMT